MEKPSWSLKDAGRIYLDHNATTPPLQSVVERLPEWAGKWGNPSSIHWSGRGPKNLLREARENLARLVGCHPLELVFTGGGSESNNTVIKGAFAQFRQSPRNEYITSNVEHPSVTQCFDWIRENGGVVHVVSVDRGGRIDLNQYKQFLSDRTAFVSIMAANNETGMLFPISEMAQMAHEVGAKIHTDAVQTLGKVPIHVGHWGVDYATFASHKMYALKGTGLVYAKKGERLTSLIHGGGQERGRRAGTENILAIAAFSAVAYEHMDRIMEHSERMRELRDRFEHELLARVSGVSLTGTAGERLPNTSSLVIDDIDGESLLMNLDLEGISVSTGAACSSGNPEPSPVLIAMGLSRREAQSSLRVSLGWDTSESEIKRFITVLENVILRLRDLRVSYRENARAAK